jgi:hypothetical protein
VCLPIERAWEAVVSLQLAAAANYAVSTDAAEHGERLAQVSQS